MVLYGGLTRSHSKARWAADGEKNTIDMEQYRSRGPNGQIDLDATAFSTDVPSMDHKNCIIECHFTESRSNKHSSPWRAALGLSMVA